MKMCSAHVRHSQKAYFLCVEIFYFFDFYQAKARHGQDKLKICKGLRECQLQFFEYDGAE